MPPRGIETRRGGGGAPGRRRASGAVAVGGVVRLRDVNKAFPAGLPPDRVAVGDQVLDASVRGKLDSMAVALNN